MKRLYTLTLVFSMLAMVLGTSTAKAEGVDKEMVSKMQKAARTNTMGPSEIATFLEVVEPKLQGNHEGLTQMVASAQADAPMDPSAMTDILKWLLTSGMNPVQAYQMITEYTQKVLPIYTWLMTNRQTPDYVDRSKYTTTEVAHAPVDGGYYGIGDERNFYKPYGLDFNDQAKVKAEGGKLKKSGSYVWGMTTYDGKLYWSTNTNYMCVPGYAQVVTSGGDFTEGVDNGCWVCEYKYSMRANETVDTPEGPKVLATSGDILVPRIFCYDPETNVTEDITPKEDDAAYNVLRNCQGLRSAYAYDGLIFFGGPSLVGGSSTAATASAFVCYDPVKKEYIGSSDMSNVDGCQVTNVRRWVEINGVLYCSVGIRDTNGSNRGAVLRWYGDYENPFTFHIVGWTDCEAAEIEEYNGRLWVGGWPVTAVYDPATGKDYPYAEVYRGPVVPEGGLKPEDAYKWERVWRYQDYQNQSCYTSSMRKYKGKLYWGMFGSAFGAFYAATRVYGDNYGCADALANMMATIQSTTFWCLDDTKGDTPEVELLYGEENIYKNYGGYGPNTILPIPAMKAEPNWKLEPNGLGLKPKFGRSGYGNLLTSYTWALQLYHDKLIVGTMDMSNLIEAAEGSADPEKARMLGLLSTLLNVKDDEKGFECLVLDDPEEAPKYITSNAFGNPMSYGIRNFDVIGDDLYIGSANPHNIHDNGGWNIFRVNDGETYVPTDIKTATSDNMLMMKANEGHTVFYTSDGAKIDEVTVTDVAGRVVGKTTIENNVAYVWHNGMATGTYVATVKSGKNVWNSKFIVK